MLETAPVSNPNDFKVVKFTNASGFDFTPEMGCMYDGRPIFGISGVSAIKAGESIVLPYHIGHRLATNLAKIVQVKRAPIVDEPNNPVGRPLWSVEELDRLKNSFLEELYSEAKPLAQTETDRLMAKVEEYKGMVDELLKKGSNPVQSTPVEKAPENTTEPSNIEPEVKEVAPVPTDVASEGFQDKQAVLAELEKRGIKHDKRKSKADLEALLK